MTHSSTDTSLQAYWNERLTRKLSKMQVKVLDHINVHGPLSRSALAKQLGMRLSTVCGRVNELMEMGLLRHHDKVTDPETGMSVWTVRLKGTV